MASRDVAQLILQVDAQVATAQRAVNQLARAIQQDAAGMEGSLKKVEQAGATVGRSLGGISARTRSGFTQLSFQIGDVTQGLAMGTKASTIFAQQAGQTIQALQVMGGEGNKFLQFLGGPWGLAISTAVVVLGTLGSKLFDTGDDVGALVDKMREQARQADLTDKANEEFGNTIEGVSQALRENRKALDDLSDAGKTAARVALEHALAEAERAKRITETRLAILRQREADLKSAQGQTFGAAGGAGAGTATSIYAARIADAQKAVSEAERDLAEANRQVDEATRRRLTEVFSEGAADKIRKAYDDPRTGLIALATKQASAEELTNGVLKRRIDLLKAERDAKLKALSEEKKTSASDRQSGRQISGPEAASIARAGGLQVNSADRSYAEQKRLYDAWVAAGMPKDNPVARPGTSAHEGANGKWAIDIQITDGVTPGKIRKIFSDQGVSLTKVFKERGHFHVEGSRSEAAAAERKGESEAAKAIRQANAFAEENARLDQELLQAKTQLVRGVDAEADAQIAALQAEQERRKLGYDNDVKEGKITEANANILKAKVDQISFEKMKAVELQRSLEHMRRADELEQRSFQYRVDDLRFADEMARTQAEHRRIQLEILDVVYQQKEAHLRALQAELLLAGKIEEAADVQAEIDRLPTEKARDEERTRRGTMDPLEAWADSVPQTAAKVIEALQSIEAQGLDSLSSAITDVIMGTRSLGEAFGGVAKQIIAQIIQMTIKMLIFRALSSAFPGIFGGGAGGPMSQGVADVYAGGGYIPGFESGGAFVVGGRGGIDSNMLSINGVPQVRVSSGETVAVIPKRPSIGVPGPAGPGGAEPRIVEVHVRTDQNFHAEVAQTTAGVVAVLRPTIVDDARKKVMTDLGRPTINGRR